MNTTPRRILLCTIPLLACFTPGQAPQDPSPPPQNPLVVKVGEQEFFASDVIAELDRLIPLVSYHRKVPPEQMADFRRKAFEKLVEKSLIHQDAMARNISVTEEEIVAELRQAMAKTRTDNKEVSEQSFAAMLKQYRPLLVRRILLDKNEARFAASVPKPDAETLKTVYDRLLAADTETLRSPPEAHLLHIFVAVDPSRRATEYKSKKARIEEAHQQLLQGQPFAEVARTYSDDPSAEEGGDLGIVRKGSFRARPANDAAFALEAGELSEVIESLRGFHLIRCLEIKPRRIYTVEEVRPMLENWFASEHTKKRRKIWLDELRETIPVEVLAPEFAEPTPGQEARSEKATGHAVQEGKNG